MNLDRYMIKGKVVRIKNMQKFTYKLIINDIFVRLNYFAFIRTTSS